MLEGTFTIAGLSIFVLTNRGSQHPNQDRWLIHPMEDGVTRVAVMDGMTPWRSEPQLGDDAAQFAASTVMRNLALPLRLEDAFICANRELHSAALSPSRRQAVTMAVAVDITIERGLLACEGLLSGDCEWWVASSGDESMRLLLGGHNITQEGLDALAAINCDANPDMRTEEGFEQALQREAAALDAPSLFHRHGIGRFPQPHFTHGSGRFSAILLASDGTRLQEAPNVPVDLGSLRRWLHQVAHEEYRDDITVVAVSLRP
jgi:hypothetical protein